MTLKASKNLAFIITQPDTQPETVRQKLTAKDGLPFADIGVLLDTSSSRLSEPLLLVDLLDLSGAIND